MSTSLTDAQPSVPSGFEFTINSSFLPNCTNRTVTRYLSIVSRLGGKVFIIPIDDNEARRLLTVLRDEKEKDADVETLMKESKSRLRDWEESMDTLGCKRGL